MFDFSSYARNGPGVNKNLVVNLVVKTFGHNVLANVCYNVSIDDIFTMKLGAEHSLILCLDLPVSILLFI